MKSRPPTLRIFTLGAALLLLNSLHGLADEVWRITSLEWPPYTGKDLPEGGSAIKALRAALKTEGIQLEVDYFPWTRAIEQARNTHNYIGVFPCWPEDAERYAKDFEMLAAIAKSPVGIAEHRDKPLTIKSIDDLKGKKIGIVLGYANTERFNTLADKGEIITKTSPSDLDGLRALNAKNTDGMLIDINVMNYLLKFKLSEAKDNISINTGWIENKELLLATPINHPKKAQIKKIYEKAISNINTGALIDSTNNDLLTNKK